MSTKAVRTTRAASLLSGSDAINEAQAKALASEYRAQDKAEGAANLKRARVAYVLFNRKSAEGAIYGTNEAIGTLLGCTGQRAQQMAAEVGYVIRAGFDLSLNDVSAEAVAAHRLAMTIRKDIRPDAADKAKKEARQAEMIGDILSVAAAATTDKERAEALAAEVDKAKDVLKEERKNRAGVPGKETASEKSAQAQADDAPNPTAAVKSHLRAALAILTGDYAGTLSAQTLDDVAGLLADLDSALVSQQEERIPAAA